ncbi:MAG TPA: PAS domain-containing protein [Actinomycetota bacterium]|nr:PAS domain-containing protein [Actinomycetota bacterium]
MATAKASSEPAFRRDAMLEALAFAAQRFLERPSWIQSIDEILERLSEAVGVSRAYVLENRVGSEPLTTVLRSFWLAPGVTSSFAVGDELGFDDLERWVEILSRGEVVGGPVAELPPAERRRLEPHGIRSVLLVPVVVAGSWWGYIGFDDCVQEREWPRVEIDVLRAAGGTLAAAIDRERAEARLREAEATYRSIVETTPAITYQEHVSKGYDVSGSVLYVSPQVERILGYSARDWAEIPGFWTGILHPDDRDAVLRESDRTNRTGEPYRQEYRMLASDGRVVWFRDESVLIRDEHGEPQMWQGVMVDITEAKLAEERLREAEERFRALVEHLPAVTYREALVPTAEDFYISPRVTEVFGYTPEEWTWTPNFWSDRLHPEDRERVMEIDRDTNRSGMPYVAEYRFLKADGTYLWIHDESTLVLRPDGSGFWQGFMLDITERKEAENRLAETEERYRLLVERSPLLIYVQEIDPDSGESVTTYLSPANEALIGYTAEEVRADPTLWRRLIHPADRDRVRSADLDTNASGRDFSLEYRMVHRDGRTVWVQDVATLIEAGDRRYWQGFMLDITERKEAQDKVARALAVERDAAQRLRAVDEMKNTFLQAVSHDLRTPLAAILGLAITLERGDLGLEAKDIHDLAARIATNARKLDRMVTDLLDLDRLARGIVEPKLHPTDVSELVRRIVAESDLASGGRISLDVEPATANVDAAKVERIVENLLANASRYTPDGSVVWVRVHPSEGGVTIVVDDEGPGIAAGMRDAVFEPFRQGPGAPEHAPGVGIGLALVARFAELMGGRAWVEESPAGGASFRVYLADGPRTSAEVGTAG